MAKARAWVSRAPAAAFVGSVPGRRPNKRLNFRSGLRAILRDYFGLNGEPPVDDEGDFERRFRVPRSMFLRVYNAVIDLSFFSQRINATERLQAHPLQKLVAAFRVIAYGEAPDRTDEYVRLSAATIAMSVRELMSFIVHEFGPSYLRSPTLEDLQRILTRNAERGMPRCIGSLDCSHWEWRNCPKAIAGMYRNRHGKRFVVMETVCDEDLWIWHILEGFLDLITTLTFCMFPPSVYPLRAGNGRPAHFLSLLTARPARFCNILWMVFIPGLLFSFLRSPTPRQKSR